MSLPTSRITITKPEHELLKSGFALMLNGLQNAKAGVFPYRHAFDRIDLAASALYANQVCDADMAACTLRVGTELWAFTEPRRKVRLHVFELSIVAVALRVSAKIARQAGKPLPTVAYDALSRKLETYRKRAQRRAVTETGESGYATLKQNWTNHLAWMRYNSSRFTHPGVQAMSLNASGVNNALVLS
ncbi:hypothetical protein [Granulicella arctica]|uniref:hypothetical protein n=1 Tax=Granulicella arctica TaxID=940613 RepID=UPI0021E0B679|nr:hypothetical protein [Granulicella arctica]